LRTAFALASIIFSSAAWAHCDSLDGPVIQDARKALAAHDVTPVLKWVSAEHEDEVRGAFEQTLALRDRGNDEKALADRYFFETLVRIHRAGEGESFAGLKSALEIDPGIAAADIALATGSPDEMARHFSAAISDGIKARFAAASERKKHAEESIDAGRAYVEAYVEHIHFVERVNRLSTHGASSGHHEPEP